MCISSRLILCSAHFFRYISIIYPLTFLKRSIEPIQQTPQKHMCPPFQPINHHCTGISTNLPSCNVWTLLEFLKAHISLPLLLQSSTGKEIVWIPLKVCFHRNSYHCEQFQCIATATARTGASAAAWRTSERAKPIIWRKAFLRFEKAKM